ncbi:MULTISPECIES: hypothetical protein [Trichocoleus]|uniref:Uncharacterized protein n=1 Tax=Trichocoleus desertorum GB2-A4 TaxID=2933944 RepID=A0ABV0JCP0_9CYAN|nr:hypothetical protein [Trichocoleus sp. FACHB-46]MBD1864200.1 hypothetical protein [Trichocoleus sp. FACHB-46]
MKISQLLEGIGNSIQFYPDLVPITGSHNATTFLGQLCYWTGKERKPDGWIYKTQEEWELETELSPKEQRVARKLLKERGLIEDRFIGIPRRLEYRLIQEALDTAWEMWIPAMRIKEHLRSLLAEDAALLKHGIADPGLKEKITILRNALKRARTSPEEAKTIEKSISDQTALMEVTKRHNKKNPQGTASSADQAQLSIQPIDYSKTTQETNDARTEKNLVGVKTQEEQEVSLASTAPPQDLKKPPLSKATQTANDNSSARPCRSSKKTELLESEPYIPQYFAEEFWKAWERYCEFCDEVGADEGFSEIAARVWDKQIEAGVSVDDMVGRGMDAYIEGKKLKAGRNGGQYIGVPRFENYLGARPMPYWKQALEWKDRHESRPEPAVAKPVGKEPTPEFLGRFEEARSLLGASVSWMWDGKRDCRVVIIGDRIIPEREFMQMPLDVYLPRTSEQVFASRVAVLGAMHDEGDQVTLLKHLDNWWSAGWCDEVLSMLEANPHWGVPPLRYLPAEEDVSALIQASLAEAEQANSPIPPETLDLSEVISQIQAQYQRIGWGSDQQKEFLYKKFRVRSLGRLSDKDLCCFLQVLREQPTAAKCAELAH